MVQAYFGVGKMIVEEELKDKDRAEYGKSLSQNLSKTLTREFGKGFSATNIQQMRNFHIPYQKQQTASVEFDNNPPRHQEKQFGTVTVELN